MSKIIYKLIVLSLIISVKLNCQFYNDELKYDVIYISNEFGLEKEPIICYQTELDFHLIENSDGTTTEIKNPTIINSFKYNNHKLSSVLDSLAVCYKLNWLRIGISRINDKLMVTGALAEYEKNEDSVFVFGFCADSIEYKFAEVTDVFNYKKFYKGNRKIVMKELEKVKNFKNFLMTNYQRKIKK
jgi:hypothetical protein